MYCTENQRLGILDWRRIAEIMICLRESRFDIKKLVFIPAMQFDSVLPEILNPLISNLEQILGA